MAVAEGGGVAAWCFAMEDVVVDHGGYFGAEEEVEFGVEVGGDGVCGAVVADVAGGADVEFACWVFGEEWSEVDGAEGFYGVLVGGEGEDGADGVG